MPRPSQKLSRQLYGRWYTVQTAKWSAPKTSLNFRPAAKLDSLAALTSI
ncbi:hypothetical protein Mal4_27740 [Maioricimonas rarisocia]|uniref:Uncharacterized protein n=1 Tax=Maioricimonas rarisocia TaxID=2528026 RepID=A0A517Z7J9_9PLAN|nr:hypothetical protein Mal4_27740 [Maioricimonas rarisocia]